jgi:hypothetical protein
MHFVRLSWIWVPVLRPGAAGMGVCAELHAITCLDVAAIWANIRSILTMHHTSSAPY